MAPAKPKYLTTEFEYHGTEYAVECLNQVAILPDPEGVIALFIDKRTGVPTHMAAWTPKTARSILAELNVAVQNLPIN